MARQQTAPLLRTSIAAVCVGVIVQIALGVATIVYNVPLDLALAHQANAIVLLALALWHYHRAMPDYRPGLIQVGDNVGFVLNADRKTDNVIASARHVRCSGVS